MRNLALALLLCSVGGCANTNYAYSFDLSDPGARNTFRPGERDVVEDADVRSEILVDPTSFQAIALDITNKTDAPLQVVWSGVMVIGPIGGDSTQTAIHPDQPLNQIEPGAKEPVRLVPFALPSQGSLARAYDNSRFELVVPMIVRGTQREYRYHLVAHVHRI